MLRKLSLCVATVAAVTVINGQTFAQALVKTPIASGFINPVFVTAPPGDTSRLFVVEQRGNPTSSSARIMIVDLTTTPPTTLPTPFLTISGLATGNEQGLLGLAFHPDYATNRTFFIYYTTSGANTLARYKVQAGNPNVADPASGTTIVTWSDPESNHNGGWIAFGPDGYLYIAVGDGGGGGDAHTTNCSYGNGQCLNTYLGKLLRIAVSDTGTYTIPPTNPFFGSPAPQGLIWAFGLRNPFRCSFDRLTGQIYIGDVGQDAIEEIDVQPADVNGSMGGRNYGWRCFEGNNSYNPNCGSQGNYIGPIHTYSHSSGRNCIIGGYVYRGSKIPSLQGTYFFGDNGTSYLASLQYTGSNSPPVTDRSSTLGVTALTSFGEDAAGEMYIVSRTGTIYRIDPAAPVNDTCVNATLVGEGATPFTNVSATTDGPDESGCSFSAPTQIGADVWYKYVASCTGNATVSLCGSTFNTRVAVYAACPTGPGQVLACNDDSCGTASSVTFPVAAGNIYRVRIGGVNNATGTGTMTITCAAPPACPADTNGDSQVNVSDLLAVINGWGTTGGPADINHDNIVNVSDLLAVINAWGACPSGLK